MTHWNATAQRLFGYSPAEMPGQPAAKLVPTDRPDDLGDLETRLQDSFTGFNFETIRLHRDRDAIAISISLAPIRNAKGELTGATEIILDIREQARVARVLAESDARFKALSEVSPLGVFATDAHGACTYTNGRWQGIHGLTLEQSLGDGWASTLHPDDGAAVLAEWQRTAALGVEFDMEFRILRTDGQTRTVAGHPRLRPRRSHRAALVRLPDRSVARALAPSCRDSSRRGTVTTSPTRWCARTAASSTCCCRRCWSERVVDVKTVAEFVDRAEVLDRVREIGIDFAQGFLVHRPEPIEAVLGLRLARPRRADARSA